MGEKGSSYRLMSESLKGVYYCIMLYMDGKGIGWGIIEQDFMTIRSRAWLQPRCTDKCTAKKSEHPILAIVSQCNCG